MDIGNCSEILRRSNSSYNLDMELCAGRINRRRVKRVAVLAVDPASGVATDFDKSGAGGKGAQGEEVFIGGQV